MTNFAIEIVSTSPDRCRILLAGVLDAAAYAHLEQAFVGEVAKGRRFIVVDLGRVESLSSCVFGAFLATMALLQPMNGNMSFVNVKGVALRVLKMLGAECAA